MRVLRRQKFGFILSFLLCLIGLASLFVALWKTWPGVSSAQNPFSAFWTLVWTEQLNLIPGIEFKLAYLTILGAAMLVLSVITWALSRQWFYLSGDTVLFQCPFCKKRWRASPDKGLVHCPHCRQLVHPKMVKK